MAESYPKGLKTLWEKEKLLVTSNFSFSHSVFKIVVSKGRQKGSLCGNWLIHTVYPVFRDHPMEVMEVVSYSRCSLNAGSIGLI